MTLWIRLVEQKVQAKSGLCECSNEPAARTWTSDILEQFSNSFLNNTAINGD